MNKAYKVLFKQRSFCKKTALNAAVIAALGIMVVGAQAGNRIYGNGVLSDVSLFNITSGTTFNKIETVSGTTYDRLVGAFYSSLSNHTGDKDFGTLKFDRTDLLVKDGTTVIGEITAGIRHVSNWSDGATAVADTYKFHLGSTNLVIEGGEFKEAAWKKGDTWAAEAHNDFITAGDYIKDNGIYYGERAYVINQSLIDGANVDIAGGDFNIPIYGGTIVSTWGNQGGVADAEVKKSTMTITGGTFHNRIFLGGAAYNTGASAHPEGNPGNLVDGSLSTRIINAELTIGKDAVFAEGSEIYAGGLVGVMEWSNTPISATVDKASITVDGVNVTKIFGYGAKAVFDSDLTPSADIPASSAWTYTIDESNPIPTDLTLKNGASAKTVKLGSDSTLTVEGIATIETLGMDNAVINGKNGSLTLGSVASSFKASLNGTLNIHGDLVGADLTINNGASLSLSNDSVGANKLSVSSGANLIVDTITNTGNITVKDKGNLTIGTKITNSGTVTLEDGSTVTALLKGADLSSGTVTLIDGDGQLTNNSKLKENGIYDISWVVVNNKNTGKINVKTKSAEQIVSDINVSEQQAGTVAAVLPTIMNSGSAPASSPIGQIAKVLGTALEKTNSEEVAQIAEDLAPSTAPVVSSVSQGVNNAIAGVANARMAANRAAGDVFTGGSAWAQVIYNSADQDATKKNAKLESDTYGVALGIDGKVGDNLMIGAGLSVTKTDAESGTRDIDVDSYSLFGYTEYNADNGWFVNGMATAIRGRYEETKVPAGIKLTAKYQTTVLGAGVATGYHFENGISPEVGLRYLRTHQGSYNDGAQKIHTDGTNLLTASLGAKYEKAFEQGDWVLKPSARVAATYDVVSDDTESAVRVIGGGQYHVISEHQKRAAYEAGIGLEASNGDWDFSVSYNGEFRSHFKSHTGMIKAKYNF